MKKILVLTDFSPAATHALHYAQALFGGVTAEFCLVHAYPLQPDMAYGSTLMIERYQGIAEQELRDRIAAVRRAEHSTDHTYRSLALPGGPVGVVEVLLGQEPFDMVVLGATGRGNSEWFGSVATGLVRQVKGNILVVPATSPMRPVQRVVLAVDGSALNRTTVLEPLRELVSSRNAKLTLLTVDSAEEGKDVLSEETRSRLLHYFGPLEVDAHTVRDEDVAHGIGTYLSAHSVDLLVTIPHRKALIDVLNQRSVTRKLAYHPHVPLLTLYDPAVANSHPDEPTRIPFAAYL